MRGKWVYWYCIGKRYGYKGVECHNVNYADFKLRRISASILRLEEFDEDEFERQIKEILVLEGGSLEFRFHEGRTETWERKKAERSSTSPPTLLSKHRHFIKGWAALMP